MYSLSGPGVGEFSFKDYAGNDLVGMNLLVRLICNLIGFSLFNQLSFAIREKI